MPFWFVWFFFIQPAPQVRPPQFVSFAFDGAGDVEFWKESLRFAEELSTRTKAPFRFTYFLTCPYYLDPEAKSVYKNHQGKSRINLRWPKSTEEVALRIVLMNAAFRRGHEIGSHACSHYSGRKWTQKLWRHEFRQFNRIVFTPPDLGTFADPAVRNRIISGLLPETNRFLKEAGLPEFADAADAFSFHADFTVKKIAGFRAPFLQTNPAMYRAMLEEEFSFVYDASGAEQMDFWPQPRWKSHNRVLWFFPLHRIHVAGKTFKANTMDYNFSLTHDQWGHPFNTRTTSDRHNQAAADRRRDNLYDSYMAYFRNNYQGSRAPMQIGHHFGAYGGGNTGRRPYNEALFKFAREVCVQPDVQCLPMQSVIAQLEAARQAGTYEAMKNFRSTGNTPPRKSRPKRSMDRGR